MSEQADIRVLHVDDDSAVRELTAEMLIREDERLDVETASSASEGLNYLSSHGVDCLVSDYEMPGQNGIEFLEAVRAEHPDLPFILYTGKGSETVASDAISAGVTDYLEKSGGTEQYELLANRVCNAVEQYRSTREAERTRRRLQNLAESTSHCVWMFDRDWEELLFISGYEDIWDRPVERIRDDPRDFLNGVHPEDREFVRDAMERMSSGEPIDIEYRILQGDGESRWVWVQGEPVVDGHGTVKSVVGFTRDVTERKEREQELRRTSARLEALFESSPDMINVHDTDGNLLEPNPRLCEATGYDAAELTDMKVWDLDRTMDSDEARALWEGMAVGDSRRVEGTYRRRDGSTFPVEVHIRRLRFEAEDRFIAIARDISERKEREAEPGRHERIVQNLPVGVFRTTPDGEFVEVNQAYVSLIDAASRSDVTDTEAADLWADADDRERLLGQLEQDGVVEGREVEIETLEGESRWVETTLRIVDEDDGEYLDGVVKDVTERRERQRELRRAERRFEAVFEDPNIMLVLADTDGAVRDLNGTATEYLDAGGSAVGDPLWELPWWDERAKPVVRRKIERAADGDYVGGGPTSLDRTANSGAPGSVSAR